MNQSPDVFWQTLQPWLQQAGPYLLVALAVAGLVTLIAQYRGLRQGQRQLELQTLRLESLQTENKTLLQQAILGEESQRQLDRQQELVFELEQQLESLREDNKGLQVEQSALHTRLEQEQLRHQEQLQALQKARQGLGKEFENLANRILEARAEKLSNVNQSGIEQTLKPLREQLREFKTRVDDVYDRESRDRVALHHQIGELKSLNLRISEDAVNLTRALKGDNKTQGNWGEVVLERLLEESGLRKGQEYETQVALKSQDGERRNPDVVVRLPDNKHVVIDAKVSLLDYERYFVAEDEALKAEHLKAHIASIKGHIHGLSAKAYDELDGIRSLDFVLIFIPVETAFLLAFEHEPGLFKQAYDKNVILVSPTTLLATLRTIQSIWRYERQNNNAEDIALQAGRIHDQVVRITESLDEVGKHLGKSQDAWHKTVERLRTGRGNLLVMADKMEQLGAKTRKQLPRDNLSDHEE